MLLKLWHKRSGMISQFGLSVQIFLQPEKTLIAEKFPKQEQRLFDTLKKI